MTNAKVTRAMVDELWRTALPNWSRTHDRAEELLNQVSAENPVVNSGLTDLHALTRTAAPTEQQLRISYQRWIDQLVEYDSNPGQWVTDHFVEMLEQFAFRDGEDRGREFADRLIHAGRLRRTDVPPALRPEP